MESIQAIIAYVDAKAKLEVALRDPNAAIRYDLHSIYWQAEATRKELLAFVETEEPRELRVLRAFYNFVKLAMENPDDDSYAWLTAAIGVAEKALTAID